MEKYSIYFCPLTKIVLEINKYRKIWKKLKISHSPSRMKIKSTRMTFHSNIKIQVFIKFLDSQSNIKVRIINHRTNTILHTTKITLKVSTHSQRKIDSIFPPINNLINSISVNQKEENMEKVKQKSH